MAKTCRKCSMPLATEQIVHLWDGHDYCRKCVENACPGMADFALAHPVLESVEPISMRTGIQNLALLIAAVTAPFAMFCLVGYSDTGDGGTNIGGLAIAMGLPFGVGIVLFLIYLLSLFDRAAARRHTRVSGGIIEAFSKSETLPTRFQWKDCRIRFHDRGVLFHIPSPAECPYIYIRRRSFEWSLSPSHLTFKLSTETGRIWKGLLSLQPDGNANKWRSGRPVKQKHRKPAP